MRGSNDIFDLIKSLEKSEKRYFKLQMKKSDSNLQQNMVLLFDAIDKQKTYNEKKIKQKFAGKTFIKRLTVTKTRLYNAILKSLEAYYSSSHSDSNLTGIVEQVEILFEKGLFKQAQNLLFTIKKKALEENHFLVLQKILKTERAHFNKLVIDNETENKSNRDLNLKIIEQHKNLLDFNKIWIKFHYELINSAVPAGGTEIVEKVLNKYEQNLLLNDKQSLSIGAEVQKVSLNSFIASLNGELKKCLNYRMQLVNILEENPHLISNNTKAYINQLNNVIYSQYHSKLYNETLSSVLKLENLKNKSNLKLNNKKLLYINVRVYIARITIYRTTNNIALSIDYLKPLLRFYKEHSYLMELRNQVSFLINIALVRFFSADYNKATDACNDILGFDIKNHFLENYLVSNTILIISYFELKIDNLFESVCKSTYRFLTDKKEAYGIVLLIVKYLKSINNIIDKPDIMEKWKVFKKDVLKVTKQNKKYKNFVEEIKLIEYIDSKISKESMFKVIESNKIELDKNLV